MAITLEALINAINNLNRDFPRPKIDRLELSEPFYLTSDYKGKSFPGAEFLGVYFLFDKNDHLQYIGKASCNGGLGRRLGSHFGWDDEKTMGIAKEKYFQDICVIRTIALPHVNGFEAPAIEEYLISNLNPPLNKSGVKR
jgi:hypothetical protein